MHTAISYRPVGPESSLRWAEPPEAVQALCTLVPEALSLLVGGHPVSAVTCCQGRSRALELRGVFGGGSALRDLDLRIMPPSVSCNISFCEKKIQKTKTKNQSPFHRCGVNRASVVPDRNHRSCLGPLELVKQQAVPLQRCPL